jgi:hypothetical protein
MKQRSQIPSFALLLLLVCSSVDDEAACDGTITVAVTSKHPDKVSSDLFVSGTAAISRDSAIRSVTVGGLQANADGFNFSQWSLTVPFAALLAAPVAADGGADTVTLPVVASPACGSIGKESVTVTLNRQPEVRVETLAMTRAFTGRGDYLPADQRASAIVTLTANREARGGTVIVAATGPGVVEGLGEGGALVLAGDGSSPASASFLVKASAAGTIFLTAKSGATSAAPLSIEAADEPRIVPAAATLAPGQTLVVTILTDVEAQTLDCSWTLGPGLSVEEIAEGREYELTATSDLENAVEARLRCQDDYGQQASADFDATPPEAP